MAIETVFMQDNTSIIQDEVLSHRIGLVPIKADPRLFEFKKGVLIVPFMMCERSDPNVRVEQGTTGTEKETLVFKLDITCRRKPGSKEEDEDFENANVYR
jgi:DNA-directed RNA polymerases I and III subunit RPAC1